MSDIVEKQVPVEVDLEVKDEAKDAKDAKDESKVIAQPRPSGWFSYLLPRQSSNALLQYFNDPFVTRANLSTENLEMIDSSLLGVLYALFHEPLVLIAEKDFIYDTFTLIRDAKNSDSKLAVIDFPAVALLYFVINHGLSQKKVEVFFNKSTKVPGLDAETTSTQLWFRAAMLTLARIYAPDCPFPDETVNRWKALLNEEEVRVLAPLLERADPSSSAPIPGKFIPESITLCPTPADSNVLRWKVKFFGGDLVLEMTQDEVTPFILESSKLKRENEQWIKLIGTVATETKEKKKSARTRRDRSESKSDKKVGRVNPLALNNGTSFTHPDDSDDIISIAQVDEPKTGVHMDWITLASGAPLATVFYAETKTFESIYEKNIEPLMSRSSDSSAFCEVKGSKFVWSDFLDVSHVATEKIVLGDKVHPHVFKIDPTLENVSKKNQIPDRKTQGNIIIWNAGQVPVCLILLFASKKFNKYLTDNSLESRTAERKITSRILEPGHGVLFHPEAESLFCHRIAATQSTLPSHVIAGLLQVPVKTPRNKDKSSAAKKSKKESSEKESSDVDEEMKQSPKKSNTKSTRTEEKDESKSKSKSAKASPKEESKSKAAKSDQKEESKSKAAKSDQKEESKAKAKADQKEEPKSKAKADQKEEGKGKVSAEEKADTKTVTKSAPKGEPKAVSKAKPEVADSKKRKAASAEDAPTPKKKKTHK